MWLQVIWVWANRQEREEMVAPTGLHKICAAGFETSWLEKA